MTPTRAAVAAAVASYLVVGTVFLVIGFSSEYSPDENATTAWIVREALLVTAAFGTPLAIAAAVVAARVAALAQGPDAATRLLAFATSGLSGRRAEWGAAMRAELASIDDPRDRRSFARSCALSAVRAGTGPAPKMIAAACGLMAAVSTFAWSRISLAGEQSGIFVQVVLFGTLVLLAAGFAGSVLGRSYRAGLETALFSLVAVVIATLAVEMVETAYWISQVGVYPLDGDAPKGGVEPTPALDPLTGAPIFLLFQLLAWVPLAVMGAVLGRQVNWPRRPATADVRADVTAAASR